jgi:hypothetical protein
MGFRQFLAIEMMLCGVPKFAMQSYVDQTLRQRAFLVGNINLPGTFCFWDKAFARSKSAWGSARSVLGRACQPSSGVLKQMLSLAEHLKNDSVNWAYDNTGEWAAIAQVATFAKKAPAAHSDESGVWSTFLKDDITWDFTGCWKGESSIGLFDDLMQGTYKTGSIQGTDLMF